MTEEYNATATDELSLEVGDVIKVYQEIDGKLPFDFFYNDLTLFQSINF